MMGKLLGRYGSDVRFRLVMVFFRWLFFSWLGFDIDSSNFQTEPFDPVRWDTMFFCLTSSDPTLDLFTLIHIHFALHSSHRIPSFP